LTISRRNDSRAATVSSARAIGPFVSRDGGAAPLPPEPGDDRAQRRRARVAIEENRGEPRLFAAPDARKAERQARKFDRGHADQFFPRRVAPHHERRDAARRREADERGDGEVAFGECVGLGGARSEVKPRRLAAPEVAHVRRFDKGRVAGLALRHNLIAPASTPATKSASTRE
jgi:hypothetical protein